MSDREQGLPEAPVANEKERDLPPAMSMKKRLEEVLTGWWLPSDSISSAFVQRELTNKCQ